MFKPYPKPVKQEKKPKQGIARFKAPSKPVDERSTISASTYRQLYQSADRTKKKYRNKSQVYITTLYGTRTFQSIKEANYCEELDWRLKKGEIKHYDLQPKIDIKVNGKHICNYLCDFRVIDKHGQISYHEVKSNITMTAVWKLKWALVMALRNELLEPGSELVVIN
jgi:hypothetical protein